MPSAIHLKYMPVQNHLQDKTMMACIVQAVPLSVEDCRWPPTTKHRIPVVAGQQKNCGRRELTVSCVRTVVEDTQSVDQNSFLKQFGLAPRQASDVREKSRCKNVEIENNVIVIDDGEDEDEEISRLQDDDVSFGPKSSLEHHKANVSCNDNPSLQPSSRLRKLLNIDISSFLGARVLNYITLALQSDGALLNPFTVSHSLYGSDVTLDYGVFCRTPVKSNFRGRLRQREFPVKYRNSPSGTYHHHYCFGRSDRRQFCRRFDAGLSLRSYRLWRKYRQCFSVKLERLTEKEVADWRSSQRLRDYVTEMQQREAAARELSRADTDSDVITLSSDSEDEVSAPVSQQQGLVFTCHQCQLKLPCRGNLRRLVLEHYSRSHGIFDVDMVPVTQADGTLSMQIVHTAATELVNAYRMDNSAGDSASIQPNTSLYSRSILRHPAQVSDNSRTSAVIPNVVVPNGQIFSSGDASSWQPVKLHPSVYPSSSTSGPVSLIPLERNLSYRNGVEHSGGNAVSSSTLSPSSEGDVICLD